MSLIEGVNEKTAIAAVDELAAKVVPQLQPILDQFAETLVAKLKDALVGRKITITIE